MSTQRQKKAGIVLTSQLLLASSALSTGMGDRGVTLCRYVTSHNPGRLSLLPSVGH